MYSRLVTVTVKYSDEDVAAAGGGSRETGSGYYNEATGKWNIRRYHPQQMDRSLTLPRLTSALGDSGKEPFPWHGVMDSDCRRHRGRPGSRPRDMEVHLFQTA